MRRKTARHSRSPGAMGWDGFAFLRPTPLARSLPSEDCDPLATHKCGTCFFFQEAGFAGNGWCLHADRAKSADVRTLVRRNELACRNDWGLSLWTDPKEAAETGAARKLITAQAERPATEGEIGFMVNSRDGQADLRPRSDQRARPAEDALAGEDVVVGQITVMPPGMTGRRRLVDQVPMELSPRATFRDEIDADERLDSDIDPDRPDPRPGRSLETPVHSEPPDHSLSERDRNRRQRDVSSPRNRTGPNHHPLSARHMDLDDPVRPEEMPAHRRNRTASAPLQRSEQDTAESRFSATSRAPTRSAPERPVMASPDEFARRDIAPVESERVLPRGLRPAPIPGPVPSQELHRGRESEPPPTTFRPTRPASVGLPVMADEKDPVHRSSRAMPSPLLDANGSLSSGQLARTQPARRPTLPDLSDDFFTRGVISPTVGSRVRQIDPLMDRPAGPSGDQPIVEPVLADPHQEARPIRSRPAVPRLGTRVERPVTAERTIPTVAEVNRLEWTPPAVHPVQQPRMVAAPREDTGWAAPRPTTGRPGYIGTEQRHEALGDVSATEDDQRDSVRLEVPTPLRPRPADFGEYGGWFDLQSVEPRLAPELHRACETCRDFRPSENEERGWCTNHDAFTLRTVVNATDLPCISSFGCWWVPFDDTWLSEAAIRDHRNPTPLLDQTVGRGEEYQASARQRRRSQ